MKKFNLVLAISFLLFAIAVPLFAEQKDILSPEESLWLKSRNNTIVVYPAENTPPYSYKNSAGNPQGLSLDYLELIAEKIGVKIQYLTPRPESQIMTDIEQGKGDVVAVITPDKSLEQFLVFTENYVTSPAVIVVRKDYGGKTGLTLNDFNGKRMAVVNGSALESYIRTNYPRVVVDEMTDDEISLQQVVLGETDGAAMDVASLSYFLSKQILSSVKIAGDTGFEYKPAFGIPKNKVILQSILEKGLSQISASDRSLLADKWVIVPGEDKKHDSLLNEIENSFNAATLYVLLGLCVVIAAVLFLRRRRFGLSYFKKAEDINKLRAEVSGLEKVSDILAREINEVKAEEDKLQGKIESLTK
jgi:ABC-type amino acid transport substrate-binding protein